MKRVLITLCVLCFFCSCAIPSYTTVTTTTQTTQTPNIYDDTYITYHYEYFYNGIYTPVIYVGTTPWFYYRGVWNVIPSYRVKYIYYRNKPMRHRVHRLPHKPMYKPNNGVPPKHHNSVKPNTNNRPNKQITPRTTRPTNTGRPTNSRPPVRQTQGVHRTNRTNRSIR